MATDVTVDGLACRLEKLPGGVIVVSYRSPQFNALNGPQTGGEHSYKVYPCQRHQYEFWNGQLPPAERTPGEDADAEERPWWSLGAGERATIKE